MWGAVISGLFGLGKMLYGANQKNKAKKLAENDQAPLYDISDQYYNNLGLAESQFSQGGISPEMLNQIAQVSQQNLAASTSAILQGGGSVNDISKLYGIADTANRSLIIPNEQLKLQKLTNMMEARKDLAGQEIMQYKVNQLDRWKDRAVANAMLGAEGNKNISTGLDTFGTAVAQGVNYKTQPDINSAIKKMQKDMYQTDITNNGVATAGEYPFFNMEVNQMPQTFASDTDQIQGGGMNFTAAIGNPSIPNLPNYNDFNDINKNFQ